MQQLLHISSWMMQPFPTVPRPSPGCICACPLGDTHRRCPRADPDPGVRVCCRLSSSASRCTSRSARWRPGSTSTPSPLAPAGVVAGAIDPTPTIDDARRRPPDRRPVGRSPWRVDPGGRRSCATSREASLDRPAAGDGLTGYRWPLPKGRLTQPFGPTPWGSQGRRRRAVPRRDRPRDVLRRPDRGRPRRHRPGRRPALRRRHRLARRPDGLLPAPRCQEAVGDAADRRRHRRRQRLSEHVRPLREGGRQARAAWSTPATSSATRDGPGMPRAATCTTACSARSSVATIAIDPGVAKRMKLPRAEIARVDPLLVLPDRAPPTTAVDTGER